MGKRTSQSQKGVWSDRLIEIINDRLLHTSQEIVLDSNKIESYLIESVVSIPDNNTQTKLSPTVFATPSNATKQAINNIFTKEIAKSIKPALLPIRVVADFWGQLEGLSDKDKKYVMGLDESKFGRVAPYLDLVIGMPVMVT